MIHSIFMSRYRHKRSKKKLTEQQQMEMETMRHGGCIMDVSHLVAKFGKDSNGLFRNELSFPDNSCML